MRVISDIAGNLCPEGVLLTIGAFDGVHCGHQILLRDMVWQARARGMISAVLTFYPHPREVLQPNAQFRYLTTDVERARLFEALGIDLLILQPFDRELAATTARAFVQRLCQVLGMRELWVGPDFALGHDRQGDVEELARLQSALGYRLHVIDRVDADEEPVSSTRVRGLLEEGDLTAVARMLGRHYAINGIVRYGAQRGRALGFRTANLRVGPLRGCPQDGVYAVWGQAGDVWHAGVANLGRRPSFDLGERLLEVHLLDFEGSLYGKAMRVLFVERLRGERRFDDTDQLVAQVHEDTVRARAILFSNPPRDLTLCVEPAIAS